MRVNVRNVVADCPKCGGEDFDPLASKDAPLPSDAQMRCASCGAVATYVELILRIARKTVDLSAAARHESQKRRAK